jgi:hypothetical protein
MNSFKGGSRSAVIFVWIDRFLLQGRSEVAVLVVKAIHQKKKSEGISNFSHLENINFTALT